MITQFKLFELFDLDTIVPKGPNNLFYTRKDFIKMLGQVIDFYYDEIGIEFLGSGAEGNAYRIKSKDGTKVLKITKDIRETSTIDKIRKYIIPGLVNYYDVRRIIDSSDIYFTIYSIIMENVKPLNDMEKSVWTFLRGYFFDFKEFKKSDFLTVPGDKMNYSQFIKTNSLDRLNDIYNQYKNQKNIKQNYYIADKIDRDLIITDQAYEIMLKFYDTFCLLVKEAIKHKIKLKDLHNNNVGKDDNGNYKFFDVLYGPKEYNFRLKPIEIDL